MTQSAFHVAAAKGISTPLQNPNLRLYDALALSLGGEYEAAGISWSIGWSGNWGRRIIMEMTADRRARALAQVNAGGPIGLFLGTDIFVLALILYDYKSRGILYDYKSRGQVHPASMWGGLLIVVFKPLLFAATGTSAWLAFADALR